VLPDQTQEHSVEVLVAAAYSELVSPGPVRAAVLAALSLQRVQPICELAVVVTDARVSQELNRRHRGVDAPTDVLAFSHVAPGRFVEAPGQSHYLGDVVIAYPKASEQADELGHTVEAEIQLLAVHGVLHLLGYDDGTDAKRARMWTAQEEVIAHLGIRVTVPA
jgi:probable rRNA maturation factor